MACATHRHLMTDIYTHAIAANRHAAFDDIGNLLTSQCLGLTAALFGFLRPDLYLGNKGEANNASALGDYQQTLPRPLNNPLHKPLRKHSTASKDVASSYEMPFVVDSVIYVVVAS